MSRFAWTIIIAFVLLIISWLVFVPLTQVGLSTWLRYVWGPLFLLSIGASFLWHWFFGMADWIPDWEFLKPTEAGLALLIALGASLLIALAYRYIPVLLK